MAFRITRPRRCPHALPLSQRERGARRSFQHIMRVVLDRAEPGIEWVIRLCGWSAILFVFSIFFFVFRAAAPVLFGKLNLIEFFTSARWQPSSDVRPEYGTLALLVGTLSVTALAMALAVPLGLGAAVYISEFCSGKSRKRSKSSSSFWRPSRRSCGDSSATWCSAR